jgi:DNA helicase HerA-like ATPase
VREQHVIGRVENISFKGAAVRFDSKVVEGLRRSADTVLALSGGIGGQVKIKVGRLWLFGNVGEIQNDGGKRGAPLDTVLATVDFLGEGEETPAGGLGQFRRGVSRFPRTGDPVAAVCYDDLAELFGANTLPNIEIGAVYPTPDIRASLYIDPFLGKHFAILGSTGSGKSTATALILHRIIEKAPDAHVIVLDPHGEYGNAFRSQGVVFNVDNLALPYWLMSFEEHAEVFIQSEGVERELDKAILAEALVAARSRHELAKNFRDLTVNSPVPYLMFELQGQLKAQMGKLDNASAIARYMRLSNRIDEVLQDSRYNFMFSRALASDTMKEFLARILRLPANGKPISIIDLSGVPSDIVAVVVALLSRIVLDFAVWSREERPRPVLLVCEEAHRYLPAIALQGSSSVRTALERIAKEGRKYGVSLGLVTQRPSDLAEGALSQCGTIIAMRLNNDRDQRRVRDAMPEGGRSFLDSIPALRRGECIIVGEGVAIPMRVGIDELEADKRPRSEDPSFSANWAKPGGESEALDRTIHRWRSQTDSIAKPEAEPVSLFLRNPGSVRDVA